MQSFKNFIIQKRRGIVTVVGIVLLFVLALALLWSNNLRSNQAVSAQYLTVYFDGEYRIGTGEWNAIAPDRHIPSNKGDVTLRGMFYLLSPNGDYIGPVGSDINIAFFLDHINVTVYEEGLEPHVMDNENPLFGSASCGVTWVSYALRNDDSQQLELVIHNPHSFGNSTAIDDLLSNFSVWVGIDFERSILNNDFIFRNVGLLFIIIAFVMFGTGIFSTFLHIEYNAVLWVTGLAIAFAGGYIYFNLNSVFLWSSSVTTNTTALGLCLMFYMLFLSLSIGLLLVRMKKIAIIATVIQGCICALFIIIPMVSAVYFYDTLVYWAVTQSVLNSFLIYCIIREVIYTENKIKLLYICCILPLLSFEVDLIATAFGFWSGSFVSTIVFIAMFFVLLLIILQIIPTSINATLKARKLQAEKNALDAELAQSRISTMISQIRPHFIYNTLGSIEQLCELDPRKAGELVHNFAKYLRGNFGELDNPNPILMSREMQHVRHYINIENIRFPDMTFTFEMDSSDFYIPALTIQPLVENAIKHGLMKLQHGGYIYVYSYETETHYVVSVKDNGVGFDTGILLDDRKHVGLRNIRGRLEAIVGGTLEINSTVGVGTEVLIKIPKEMEK